MIDLFSRDTINRSLQKFHFGEIATSNFYISIIAGIGLALSYDVNNPFKSITFLITIDHTATFFHNLHYWSSHLFLIFTFLHTIDHLIRKTDKKVNRKVWLHLTFSIFLIFYLMLSGFILKGDYESNLAASILRKLIQSIPLVGEQISYFLIGNKESFQIVYFQHIATGTILLLYFIIEHSKVLFPNSKIFIISLFNSTVFSLVLTPLPIDEFSNILKGPWYFIGIQEILHHLSVPVILVFVVIFLGLLFYIIKFVNEKFRIMILNFFAFITIIYLILSLIGMFFRGENWVWVKPSTGNFNVRLEVNKFFYSIDNNPSQSHMIKFINNRVEGCMSCHKMQGLGEYHNPDSIGCYSCHRGNPFTLNDNIAHKNLVKIPGNLENGSLTCGSSSCHPDIHQRVKNSIMTTMSGVISVDKFVFNEIKRPEGIFNISEIGYSNAESHLRNLCASCHLFNEKVEFGKITEQSRGGGCLACHLNYSSEAEAQLNNYKKSAYKYKEFPTVHPSIDLKITNEHCFGCHSRSGRISTNYEGWAEISSSSNVFSQLNIRKLEDGRIFIKNEEDVHYKAGMDCIDCHISQELMGDGSIYSHKEMQIKISCEDCHSENVNFISVENSDYETQKILRLRNYLNKDTLILLATRNGKYFFTNRIQTIGKQKYFITKNSNKKLKLTKPSKECKMPAHKNLSCQSCHSSWAYFCVNCHTYYNKNIQGFDFLDNKSTKGSWLELSSDFYTDYPALGMIKDEKGDEKITTFIPGMIINISKEKKIVENFKRLYAPTFTHTISKKSRSCKSCHSNPLAIGYGKGNFEFINKEGQNTIIFKPKNLSSPIDLIPLDGWIKFLHVNDTLISTRINAKPLSREIQIKVLEIGACLNCHTEKSKVMKASLSNYDSVLANLSSKCFIPKF